MLTFAYVPCVLQFPFGGDVSVILPMRSSAGTPWGAQNWVGVGPLSRFPVPLRPKALPGLSVRLFPMPLRASVQSARNFRRFGLTQCAASLSVEESRLARRPPRKRRAAAFTPRSETTIGTGLNSSKRDDIQTMDRHVFRAVVLRRNGTENRVKQLAHFVPNRCRSITRVWACTLAYYFFRFVSWLVEVDRRYRVTLKYSAHSSSERPAAACSSAARTNSSITDRCVTASRRASLCSAKAVAVETQTFIRRSPLSPAVARFFRYAACRSAVVLAIATPLHSNRIVGG